MSRQLNVSKNKIAAQRVRHFAKRRGLPATPSSSSKPHPGNEKPESALTPVTLGRGRKEWNNFALPVREELLPQFTGTTNTADESKKRRMSRAVYAWDKYLRKIGATKDNPMGDGSTFVPASMLRSFTSACVVNAGYRLDSYRTVYRRGIVEWLEANGFTVPDDAMSLMSKEVANLVNQGKVTKQQLKTGDSSTPMRGNDLDLIAASYPEGAADKVEFLAYLSLGNHTGARGISTDSAHWENMSVPVVKGGVAQIVHVFTTTKGSHQDARLTIEGRLDDTSGSNHVYWFREHVREQLGDPNASIGDFVGKLQGPVFPRSRMDYSNRLRQVTEYAGYPEQVVFSLHSVRSGFLADVVINYLLNGKSWMDAWHKASMIGGWKDSESSSQREYVKKQLQRIVVATRVRDGGARDTNDTEADAEAGAFFGNGTIAENMLSPEGFHDLPGPIVPWWPDTQKLTFMQTQVGAAAKTIEHAMEMPSNGKARRWIYREMVNMKFPNKAALRPYKDILDDATMRNSTRHRAIMARWSLANQGPAYREQIRSAIAAATEAVIANDEYQKNAKEWQEVTEKTETYVDVVKKKLPQKRIVWTD